MELAPCQCSGGSSIFFVTPMGSKKVDIFTTRTTTTTTRPKTFFLVVNKLSAQNGAGLSKEKNIYTSVSSTPLFFRVVDDPKCVASIF